MLLTTTGELAHTTTRAALTMERSSLKIVAVLAKVDTSRMICALTITGDVYSSAPPYSDIYGIRFGGKMKSTIHCIINSRKRQLVTRFKRISALSQTIRNMDSGENRQTLCIIREDESSECYDCHDVIRPFPWAAQLAPHGYYRIMGGVEIIQCPGSAYSNSARAITATCSGPCSAGYMGSSNASISLNFATAACNGPGIVGHYCPLGNNGLLPCPQGTYGDVMGLKTSSCSGDCGVGARCDTGTVSMICASGYFLGDDGSSAILVPSVNTIIKMILEFVIIVLSD